MFKLTIFTKLFLVLLLCMLAISGTILVSVQWSFKQGFNQYLLQAEANQLDKLVKNLQIAYVKNGGWQFLQDNPPVWINFLRQGLNEQHLPPKFLNQQPFGQPSNPANRAPEDFDPPPHRPPPPFEFDFEKPDGPPPPHLHGFGPPPRFNPPGPNEPHLLARFLGSRIQLLDADKLHVVGFPKKQHTEILRPIEQNNKIIGWLSIQSSDLITDHLAQLFVTQQIRNNYLIAALTIGLAVLSSLLLTRKLLVPIERLTAGANALVKGKYETQIKISSRDELGQLADNFNLLARTLKSNEQARRRWIADISHELRTPLAILRGEIEAVQDGIRELSPENIKSLYAEVMSLNRLVDDLYELSLSDLGDSHYQKEALDVINILQEVINNQQPRFQTRQLAIHSNFNSDSCLIVQGDARRLHQLFSNLCENSRRYTAPGGYCEIAVKTTDTQVIINFQDTPPGVPDESLDKLFDRLYRVDTSRNRELGGAGLGLAICKAIVSAHHGTIEAFHSAYGGLNIRVTLPRLTKI